jgi:DNA mismatch endonuclease (patch repair protein)
MTDFLTSAERSERMSRIRGKDTKPELHLRSLLHARGLRYRLHASTLPGRPDLVFPRYRAAVFVHGCFWHGHFACRLANQPKSNSAFWKDKFKKNQSRDTRNIAELEQAGWRVLVVWECELSSRAAAERAAERVVVWLLPDSPGGVNHLRSK